jgi:hypothetical protein
VLQVLGAHFLRLGVRLEVGLAVRQAQAAGEGERDHLRGIGIVLARCEAEEQALVGQRQVQAGQQGRQLALRTQGGDALQVRFQRLGAARLDGLFVHARTEVIADLLLAGAAAVLALRQVLEDAPQVATVFLRQLAVHRPARLVGRDRVVLHPAAAGVLVEVDAGVGAAVHRADVQAGRVGEGSGRTFRGRGGRGGLGGNQRRGADQGQKKC